jgi:hypothetical protein
VEGEEEREEEREWAEGKYQICLCKPGKILGTSTTTRCTAKNYIQHTTIRT